MKNFLRNNKFIILGLIIGIIFACGTVYAATIYYDAEDISYIPTSGMNATDTQSALDELYSDYQAYKTLYDRVGTVSLTTTSQNLSGAVNEINANTWTYLDSFINNTSKTVTLPSSGTYLIATGHNSATSLNTLWVARTGGNRVFCISRNCASANVTFTLSGTSLTGTATSLSGLMNVFMVKMPD